MQAFILMPNINRHTDKLHLLCSKDAEKRRLSKAPEGGGISFTVWTIHPSILQGKIKADGDAENPEVHSPHLFMGTQKRLEAVKEGDYQVAQPVLSKAFQAIDKNVKRGIVHKNTAARKKSQLHLKVKKLEGVPAASE